MTKHFLQSRTDTEGFNKVIYTPVVHGLINLIDGSDAALTCFLRDELDLPTARHKLLNLLRGTECTETVIMKLSTALTEIGSNVLKYGRGGVACIWVGQKHKHSFVTIKVIDEGPGIPNIDWAMGEHHTSGGSLGLGLSGAARLVDHFEIISPVPRLGRGTLVVLGMTWKLD